jgi:hypothetical protein
MKKKKEIEFNPADYDYMDDMPIEGWIWEFIRRSEKYKIAYNLRREKYGKHEKSDDFAECLRQYEDSFFKSHSIKPYYSEDYKEKWSPGKRFIYSGVSKVHPLKVMNLKYGTNTKKELLDENEAFFNDPLIVLTGHTAHSNTENIVMALIDISTPQSVDEILKSLKQELLLWRKALKLSKTRSAKTPRKKANKLIKNARIWKSYLIVYDLVDSGKSLEGVSDVLSLSDEFYSDVKNVENHYKNALALLNGGYRKYL